MPRLCAIPPVGGRTSHAAVGYLALAMKILCGIDGGPDATGFNWLVSSLLADHTVIEGVIVLNGFAAITAMTLTWLLLRGTQDSATFVNIM